MSKHKQLPVKLMLRRQHTSCPTSGLESRMDFETLRSSQNTYVILISRTSFICDSTLGTVIQIPPFQIDDRLSSLKTIYLLHMSYSLFPISYPGKNLLPAEQNECSWLRRIGLQVIFASQSGLSDGGHE